MVSSLARFRHLLKQESSEQTKACIYDEHSRDKTRDEKFPHFTRDLYFSVFPAPLNAMDRRVGDDKETDPNNLLKFMYHMGTSRLGKSYSAQRIDLTPYSITASTKPDSRLVVVMTRVDAKRVDYMDIVRAVEPFMFAGTDVSPFLGKILFNFRASLPYMVENYYFVCEYWQHGVSLCHRLQQVGRMREDEAKFYVTELIDAVACVHKYGKILRRLCICNILIDHSGHIKLVPYTMCDQNLDCGQACNMLVKNCGDQFYAAPEVVFGVDVQPAADWWSLGVILYQLLTGELPFGGRTLGDLGKAITECPLTLPVCVSGEASAFLKHILHKDPRRRLGFCEAMSIGEQGTMNVKDHPFLQQVLWRSVRNTMQLPPFVPQKAPPSLLEFSREKMQAAQSKLTRQTST